MKSVASNISVFITINMFMITIQFLNSLVIKIEKKSQIEEDWNSSVCALFVTHTNAHTCMHT